MTKAKTRAASGAKTVAGHAAGKLRGKKTAHGGGASGRRTKTPALIPASTMLVREEEEADAARVKRKGGAPAAAAVPAANTHGVVAPRGKLGQLIVLMRRPGGASLADLMTATGWQAHSVRGAISGAVKKKLGLAVETHVAGGVRRWHIAG